jgi:hypothetical protein
MEAAKWFICATALALHKIHRPAYTKVTISPDEAQWKSSNLIQPHTQCYDVTSNYPCDYKKIRVHSKHSHVDDFAHSLGPSL